MIFREIRKLYKQGYKNIVGLDEAGRGSLAGPVVAGAVVYHGIRHFSFSSPPQMRRGKRGGVDKIKSVPLRPSGTSPQLRGGGVWKGIRDSKKLSEKQRDVWHKILTNHPDLEWGVGIVSEKIIDRINILEATKLAMIKAVRDLEEKISKPADFLIIDGNFSLNPNPSENVSRTSPRNVLGRLKQKAIPKADEKIFSCMAAGIIAKVTRDRIMRRLHKKYSQYGFDRHKGYGTKAHLRALKKHGPCEIHRKSFRPVKKGIRD